MNTSAKAQPIIKSLVGCAQRQMSRDETDMFVRINLATHSRTVLVFTPEVASTLGVAAQILADRLKICPGVQISELLGVWVSSLCSSPHHAVLWAWTLREMFLELHGPLVEPEDDVILTVRDWVNKFPMGVPTLDGYTEVWDAQKAGGFGSQIDKHINWMI